jgi:hypothetical protein
MRAQRCDLCSLATLRALPSRRHTQPLLTRVGPWRNGSRAGSDLGAVLRGDPPYHIMCPACGLSHLWAPLEGLLFEIKSGDNSEDKKTPGQMTEG